MPDTRYKAQLASMKDWQLAAFCVALTERLYPNYALFSRLTEFGNANQVRQIINGVWDYLGNTGAKMNFETQLDKVEANFPDLDEYRMYGALPAYDAVVSLYSTLNVVLSADPDEAENVSSLSRECVATFIEVTEADDQLSDEDLVKMINTHELMETEDDFQDEVLNLICGSERPNKALLAELRELAHNDGYSNIGISDES